MSNPINGAGHPGREDQRPRPWPLVVPRGGFSTRLCVAAAVRPAKSTPTI